MPLVLAMTNHSNMSVLPWGICKSEYIGEGVCLPSQTVGVRCVYASSRYSAHGSGFPAPPGPFAYAVISTTLAA